MEQAATIVGAALGMMLILSFPDATPISSAPSPVEPSPIASPTPSQPNPSTALVVDLSDATVYVLRDDSLIAKYPVSTGRTGFETPTGRFAINHKQVNPKWQNPWTGEIHPPGANSPIGDRWIGFLETGQGHIGFHGTPDEGTVGQPASSGCLRIRRSDLHALYSKVEIGTPVTVRP